MTQNLNDEDEISQETWDLVNRKYLIYSATEFLLPLKAIEPASALHESFLRDFIDGLQSVVSSATLPYELTSKAVYDQRFLSIWMAEKIRARSLIGRMSETEIANSAHDKSVANLDKIMRTEEGFESFIKLVATRLSKQLESPSVAHGSAELLVQGLISTWSVFESATRDFIVRLINSHPEYVDKLADISILSKYFGRLSVDIKTISRYSFDIQNLMGDILFEKRRLDSLNIIREILEAIFEDPDIRQSLGESLWLLNQRRHLFVHRRGIVDQEFLDRTGSNAPLSERLELTSSDLEDSLVAVQKAVSAIATTALPRQKKNQSS